MEKKNLLQIAIIVLGLFTIGCANSGAGYQPADTGSNTDGNTNPVAEDQPADTGSNTESNKDMAKVFISFPTSHTRSAYTDDMFAKTTSYQLVITKKDNSKVFDKTYDMSQAQEAVILELAIDTYTFTLKAYKDSELLGIGTVTKAMVIGDNYISIESLRV